MNVKKLGAVAGVVVIFAGVITWTSYVGQDEIDFMPADKTALAKAKTPTVKAQPMVRPFEVDMASEPTINPTDPYDPMPLRIGTVGASAFHRPFCAYAKQSLVNYGLEKRINYWTREQVAESGRPGDHFCMAMVFDCSDITPEEFALAGNDPWCGANIRRDHIDVAGIDAAIAGKTLCSIQGYIGVFVDDPNNCIDGNVRGSLPDCDQEACGACTADCETVCEGCTLISLAPINKVTLGMGDANADGQENLDDYLFYHECYSGPIAATIPCQNVFDFDGDADVDTADFDLFVGSYNSGNAEWAAINHPDAVVNPTKPELPLRVGTDGAGLYHRLNCPSVNASWERHGIEKRADFYNWEQIESSGRLPDTAVCFAGTKSNPSGSLQDCSLDDDGDGTLNCDDQCPSDPLKIVPGVCGCGVVDPTDGSDCP